MTSSPYNPSEVLNEGRTSILAAQMRSLAARVLNSLARRLPSGTRVTPSCQKGDAHPLVDTYFQSDWASKQATAPQTCHRGARGRTPLGRSAIQRRLPSSFQRNLGAEGQQQNTRYIVRGRGDSGGTGCSQPGRLRSSAAPSSPRSQTRPERTSFEHLRQVFMVM